jgi:hypothetical protein
MGMRTNPGEPPRGSDFYKTKKNLKKAFNMEFMTTCTR